MGNQQQQARHLSWSLRNQVPWFPQQPDACTQLWTLLDPWRGAWVGLQPLVIPIALIDQGFYVLGALTRAGGSSAEPILAAFFTLGRDAFTRGQTEAAQRLYLSACRESAAPCSLSL